MAINPSQLQPTVDLSIQNTNAYVEYDGDQPNEYAGVNVDFGNATSNVKPDLIVGAFRKSSDRNRTANGEVYVFRDSQTATLSPQFISNVPPFLTVRGEETNNLLGRAVAGGPNFFAAGAHEWGPQQGAMYYIPASEIGGILDLLSPSAANRFIRLVGENPGDTFGIIIKVMDVDQNGKADIIVCAATHGNGRCYILWDVQENLPLMASVPLSLWNSTNVMRADGLTTNERLADNVVALGDLYNNGSFYFALCSSQASDLTGICYVIKGGPSLRGVTNFPLYTLLISGQNAGFVIEGLSTGDLLSSIAAGFLNNDIWLDLAVASHGAMFAGNTGAGTVAVYYGNAQLGLTPLNSTQANMTIGGAHPNDFAGQAVLIAQRMDGTNGSSLFISAYGYQNYMGTVYSLRLLFLSNNTNVLTLVNPDGRLLTQFIGHAISNEDMGNAMAVSHPTDGSIPQFAISAYSGSPNSSLSTAGRIYYLPGGCSNVTPTIVNNSITLEQGQTVTLNNSMISATCNGDMNDIITFYPTNVQHGYFALTGTTTAITSFTQAQVRLGQIVFIHDGSISAPSWSMSASSMGFALPSQPQIAAISFSFPLQVSVNNFLFFPAKPTLVTSADFAAAAPGITSGFTFHVIVQNGKFCLVDDVNQIPLSSFTDAQLNASQIEFIPLGGTVSGQISVTYNSQTTSPVAMGFDPISTPRFVQTPSLTIQPDDTFEVITTGTTSTVNIRGIDTTQSDPSKLVVIVAGTVDIHSIENIFTDMQVNNFTQGDLANGYIYFYLAQTGAMVYRTLAFNVSLFNGYIQSPWVAAQISCPSCVTPSAVGGSSASLLPIIGPVIAVTIAGAGAVCGWERRKAKKSVLALNDAAAALNRGNGLDQSLDAEKVTNWDFDYYRVILTKLATELFAHFKTRRFGRERTAQEDKAFLVSLRKIFVQMEMTPAYFKALDEPKQKTVITNIVQKIAVALGKEGEENPPLAAEALTDEIISTVARLMIQHLGQINQHNENDFPGYADKWKAIQAKQRQALAQTVTSEPEPGTTGNDAILEDGEEQKEGVESSLKEKLVSAASSRSQPSSSVELALLPTVASPAQSTNSRSPGSSSQSTAHLSRKGTASAFQKAPSSPGASINDGGSTASVKTSQSAQTKAKDLSRSSTASSLAPVSMAVQNPKSVPSPLLVWSKGANADSASVLPEAGTIQNAAMTWAAPGSGVKKPWDTTYGTGASTWDAAAHLPASDADENKHRSTHSLSSVSSSASSSPVLMLSGAPLSNPSSRGSERDFDDHAIGIEDGDPHLSDPEDAGGEEMNKGNVPGRGSRKRSGQKKSSR